MSRHTTKLAVGVFWLMAACDSGGLDSHRVPVPARLVFREEPTAVIAGAAIRPAVVVVVQDEHGNAVTTASSEIKLDLGSNPGGSRLSGTLILFAVAGVATFSDLNLDRAGIGYTLTASSAGLSGATSNSFNVSQAPTHLAFLSQPSTTAAGHLIAPAVQVAVQDELGNTVESASVRVTVGIGANPSQGSLAGVRAGAVINGLATFSNLRIDNPGNGYTLSATTDGLEAAISKPFDVRGAFSAVSSGAGHSCGLDPGGAAYCWGSNYVGQLGNNSITDSTVPVAVVGSLSFAAVSCGADHTCGVTTAGAAYCWGSNGVGQLGVGSTAQNFSSTPLGVSGELTFASVTSGRRHTCGVTDAGKAYCWGKGPTTESSTPMAVAGGLTFAAVSTGELHSCGVTTQGMAYCWGENESGELGDGSTTGSTTPVAVAGGLTFAAVTTGGLNDALGEVAYAHSCGLTTAGSVYCWGDNRNGQLGDGSKTDSSTPVPVAGEMTFRTVSAGTRYTCGVATAGTAYCWGANGSGQLGNGSTTGTTIPAAVAGGLDFAAALAGSGHLEPDLPHACGVTTVGAAFCWGDNHHGQLGTDSLTSSPTPARIYIP